MKNDPISLAAVDGGVHEPELPARIEVSGAFVARLLRVENRLKALTLDDDDGQVLRHIVSLRDDLNALSRRLDTLEYERAQLLENVAALITEPAVPVLEEATPGHVAALGQNGILRGGARHHGPLGRKPEGTPTDGEQLISEKE